MVEFEGLKEEITEILKQGNIYEPRFCLQVEIIAMLLTKCKTIYNKMQDENYEPVKIAISREGHEKQYINNYEMLLMRYLELLQKSLRSLGLNAEIVPKMNDNSVMDFMSSILRR